MNVRRLAATALTVAALAGLAAPASATCYVGQIDICDKPTDPYTDPIQDDVRDVYQQPVFDPAWGVVGDVSQAYAEAYGAVLCLTGPYHWC